MAFPPHHGFMFHANTTNPYHENNNNLPSHDHLPSPSSLHSYPPQFLHGGGNVMMRRSTSFSGVEVCNNIEEMNMNGNTYNSNNNGDDELSEDDGSQLGEKKKRLNIEQVKALEKSFELGNKLEPERKMQLAKALGLQPRQVAIWFQNRRARWKSKQLEKDYDVLKKQFDGLKADNDALQAQNKKLHQELLALKSRDCNEVMNNIKKENDQGSWSNGSDQNSCDVNLDVSRSTSTTQLLISTPIINNNLRPNITSMTQLLQGSSNNHHQFVQDDQNLCNMFNSNGNMDVQQGFNWSWPDHQHIQHFH